jgi:hypothetical protein
LASRDQSRIARIGGHQLNLAIHESISHVLEGDRVTWFFLGGERVVWYNVLVYIYIYLFIYVYIYIHHCARAHTHTHTPNLNVEAVCEAYPVFTVESDPSNVQD